MGRFVSQIPVSTVSRRYFPCKDPLYPREDTGGGGVTFLSGGHCVSQKRPMDLGSGAQLSHVTIYLALTSEGLAAHCATVEHKQNGQRPQKGPADQFVSTRKPRPVTPE